jgi:uncharacterized protein with von Willebrand factor type A (vWA) domain
MRLCWLHVKNSHPANGLSQATARPRCTACRLHAVLCDLVPGGHSKEISAARAAKILEQFTPSGAVARARAEPAAEFLADLRRLDTQLRDTRKKHPHRRRWRPAPVRCPAR